MDTFDTRPSPPTDIHPHSPVDPPPSTAPPFRSPRPWTTGLFGCCEDIPTCCLTCWCPCVTFGRIAEIVDQGSSACGVCGAVYAVLTCFVGWSCIYSCLYRSAMRDQFNLENEPCDDCCVHCCCECCALCQEYRELTNRGFDLSIGWHGNVARQKRLAAVQPPAVQPQMSR